MSKRFSQICTSLSLSSLMMETKLNNTSAYLIIFIVVHKLKLYLFLVSNVYFNPSSDNRYICMRACTHNVTYIN